MRAIQTYLESLDLGAPVHAGRLTMLPLTASWGWL